MNREQIAARLRPHIEGNVDLEGLIDEVVAVEAAARAEAIAAQPVAVPEEWRNVIENHCADLNRTAVIVRGIHPAFEKTAAEIELAANELSATLNAAPKPEHIAQTDSTGRGSRPILQEAKDKLDEPRVLILASNDPNRPAGTLLARGTALSFDEHPRESVNETNAAQPIAVPSAGLLMECALFAARIGLVAGTSNWAHCMQQQLTASQPEEKSCWNCHKCLKGVTENGWPVTSQRMIVCSTCHNKRCPKASDHGLECTGSNEPGQPGSIFGQPEVKL